MVGFFMFITQKVGDTFKYPNELSLYKYSISRSDNMNNLNRKTTLSHTLLSTLIILVLLFATSNIGFALIPPDAVDDYYDTLTGITEDTGMTLDVLSNDTGNGPKLVTAVDLLTYSTIGHVTIGVSHLDVFYDPNNQFDYLDTGDIVSDQFGYTLLDDIGSDSAMVTVEITGINDNPIAMDDLFTTERNRTLNATGNGVLANDSDAEGHAFDIVLDKDVDNGLLILDQNGSFSYMPDPGFWGIDTFEYHLSENNSLELLDSNTATVTISVMPTGILTNGDLRTFDHSDTEGTQFNVIFTPHHANVKQFELTATNPGQFSYNIYSLYSEWRDVSIPLPFITQGTMSVQFYENASMEMIHGEYQLIPVNWISSTDMYNFTLDDHTGNQLEPYRFSLIFPDGARFATIHLDYGLKKSEPYAPYGPSHLDARLEIGDMSVLENLTDHHFVCNDTWNTIQNNNIFKKLTGIGGYINAGVPEQLVTITSDILPAPVFINSDEDGWYMWNYKHRSKGAYFTITTAGADPQIVYLKANKYVRADFDLE